MIINECLLIRKVTYILKIYTTSSCSSCRKAVNWAQKHKLPYEEINLNKAKLTKDDLRTILSLSEEGADELIAKESIAYKQLNINFQSILLDELLELMLEYRSLIKRPILIDDTKVQIGYHMEHIRKFLPRSIRKVQLNRALENLHVKKSLKIKLVELKIINH